eukprot:NODE_3704_length_1998_cov_5.353287.p1 GENE.NODE_3704_length_1998_cov_5.353287~~NODE_3704_length_1998_cov_5.353287.p1  ORF type:complete len:584 (-),score=185.76 NODE_3704_length_1998_cov_5.353287:73-1824(-)
MLEGQALTEPQRRIVESELRSMRHTGVALEGEAKTEFNNAALRLSELSTKFSNNVLDATKAFELIITNPAELEGLPHTALAAAAQSYAKAKPDEPAPTPEAGPWRLTLDLTCFLPVLKFVKADHVREQLYKAYISRASGMCDGSNEPIIDEKLALRRRAANLLGYDCYAEQSLASKMADDVGKVEQLTADLFDVARPAAERELAELQSFAAERGHKGDLKHWSVAFWSERLKEERLSYDEEALRPYFALPRVLNGMFGVASRLFGVQIEQVPGDEVDRWHPDVMVFNVHDGHTNEHMATFFLDPYSRPGDKRGGAWMCPAIGRSRALNRKPVAYLCCNGTLPIDGKPSLMTFSEASTLFHEFGHGLQHMLTRVEEGDAAGINNIEWDAVELPSQFMENWLFHRPTMDSFARHFESDEPLPADAFSKILATRSFQSGMGILRQLMFGVLDMELHSHYRPEQHGTPSDVQSRVAEKYSLLQPLPQDRFLCGFAHIFAGGYAAGYYSYKWAEVLSADAFAAFEEADLDNAEALAVVGRRFRETILAAGGARHPGKVYRDFRGKDATVHALLRHNGLLGNQTAASRL